MLHFSTSLVCIHIFQALLQNEARLLFCALTAVVLFELYICLCKPLEIKHLQVDENGGERILFTLDLLNVQNQCGHPNS